MTSCAGNWDTNGDGHAVWSHHLSWSAHWHLVAFSLRHLMAERLSMGDGNRTCSDEVITSSHCSYVVVSTTVSVCAEHCCSWWQACSSTVWQTCSGTCLTTVAHSG